MKLITDQQWWEISDYASYPMELSIEAHNHNKFWLYDREFGYFIVRNGNHELLMAHLWAYRNGHATYANAIDELSYPSTDDLAEQWLQMPGTCFHSSVGSKPTVWEKSNLDFNEKRILGPEFLEFEE